MSKAVERPVCPWREEELEALVGVLGGAEAGELAHRPQPAAVHARVDAAGVRELAREADARLRVVADVLGGVQRLDLHVGDGREPHRSLVPRAAVRPLEPFALRHQRPFHAGGRFSRNARSPSTRSLLANVTPNASTS